MCIKIIFLLCDNNSTTYAVFQYVQRFVQFFSTLEEKPAHKMQWCIDNIISLLYNYLSDGYKIREVDCSDFS